MDKHSLNTIKKFASRQKSSVVTQEEIDFMYRRFSEILNSAIENREKKLGHNITDQDLELLRDSYLTDENLQDLYQQAKRHYAMFQKNIEDKVKLELGGKKTFWKTIGTNMVSNFFYTVAIVIIVYFGKDTANQFIDSFRTETKEINNYIEENQNKDNNIIEGEFEEVDTLNSSDSEN